MIPTWVNANYEKRQEAAKNLQIAIEAERRLYEDDEKDISTPFAVASVSAVTVAAIVIASVFQ